MLLNIGIWKQWKADVLGTLGSTDLLFSSTLLCVLRVNCIPGLLVRFSRRWEGGENKVGYLFLSFFPCWARLALAILFN